MTALDDYRAVVERVTFQAEVLRNATSTVPCGLNDAISWVCYYDQPLTVAAGTLMSMGVLRKSDDAFVEFGIECHLAGQARWGYQNWNPAGSFEEARSTALTQTVFDVPGAPSPSVGRIAVGGGDPVNNVLSCVMEIVTFSDRYIHRIWVTGETGTWYLEHGVGHFGGNQADWKDWLTDETVYFRAGDGTFDGTTTSGAIWTTYAAPPAGLVTKEVAQHGRHLTATERDDLYAAAQLVDWS